MAGTGPVVFGSVGLGGWAGVICNALETASAPSGGAEPPVRLAAVAEPDHTLHAEKIASLQAKGVRVFERLDEMLALKEIEAVWLPLPIDLHRPFTERALAAGKAVMCEKPAAGSVDDVDAMIAARDKAKLAAAIAYQDVYDPTTGPLKRRLVNGDIGRITHATVWACWPRNENYYNRATWAGKFKRSGTWVMDSPPNNALAHYLNIPLFLMGPTWESSANIVGVDAELYRVNRIENFDTVSMRVRLEGGATLLVLFTHACEQTKHPTVEIHGEKGKVTRTNDRIVFEANGQSTITERGGDLQGAEIRRFAKLVRGQADDSTPVATLEVARAQMAAVNGASEASAVHDVPRAVVKTMDFYGAPLHAIEGIEKAFETCIKANKMLHEAGVATWSKPAGSKDLRDYRKFAGPKTRA